jgi:hypothetical protein
MQTTGNLGLKKPEGTDVVDIADLNGNADILDTAVSSKVDKVAGKQLSTEDYTTAEKTKLAGVAAGANTYTHPANHPPSIITQDASNRFVTDTEKAAWNGKAGTTVATTTVAGLQSASDKAKLDGIAAGANNYSHPANHPPSIITQDASNRFVTDTEKATWNAKAGTASPAFTGVPTAPTAGVGTSSMQVATTAFVQKAKESIVLPDGYNSLDNLQTVGSWYVYNAVNAPIANAAFYIVNIANHPSVGGYVCQHAYIVYGGHMFTRRFTAGVWSEWSQMSNETISRPLNTDLNSLNVTGWYVVDQASINAPVPGLNYYIQVSLAPTPSYIKQIAYHANGDAMWTRRCEGGFWYPWMAIPLGNSETFAVPGDTVWATGVTDYWVSYGQTFQVPFTGRYRISGDWSGGSQVASIYITNGDTSGFSPSYSTAINSSGTFSIDMTIAVPALTLVKCVVDSGYASIRNIKLKYTPTNERPTAKKTNW